MSDREYSITGVLIPVYIDSPPGIQRVSKVGRLSHYLCSQKSKGNDDTQDRCEVCEFMFHDSSP